MKEKIRFWKLFHSLFFLNHYYIREDLWKIIGFHINMRIDRSRKKITWKKRWLHAGSTGECSGLIWLTGCYIPRVEAKERECWNFLELEKSCVLGMGFMWFHLFLKIDSSLQADRTQNRMISMIKSFILWEFSPSWRCYTIVAGEPAVGRIVCWIWILVDSHVNGRK